MKKKLILIVSIILFLILGYLTYNVSWYTYEDGTTTYNYYIYGIKYKTITKNIKD